MLAACDFTLSSQVMTPLTFSSVYFDCCLCNRKTWKSSGPTGFPDTFVERVMSLRYKKKMTHKHYTQIIDINREFKVQRKLLGFIALNVTLIAKA